MTCTCPIGHRKNYHSNLTFEKGPWHRDVCPLYVPTPPAQEEEECLNCALSRQVGSNKCNICRPEPPQEKEIVKRWEAHTEGTSLIAVEKEFERDTDGNLIERCCDNGDINDKHDCQKEPPTWEERLIYKIKDWATEVDIDDEGLLHRRLVKFIKRELVAARQEAAAKARGEEREMIERWKKLAMQYFQVTDFQEIKLNRSDEMTKRCLMIIGQNILSDLKREDRSLIESMKKSAI